MEVKAVNINGALGIMRKELEKRKDSAVNVYENRYKNHTHLWIATMKGNYYLVYKKEYFYKFGDIFNNNLGYGDSLDKEFIDFCIAKNIDEIVICHEDGKLYSITPMQFKNLAVKNNWVREVNMDDVRYVNGEAIIIKEKTYSCALKYFERFNLQEDKK